MKKIILLLLGVFTFFSLSSCESSSKGCNCIGCQQYIIVDKQTGIGVFPNVENRIDEERQYYHFILKSGTTKVVDEKTYNSYKIGDLYEGKKD